jgi:hypothetical protein
VRYSENCPTAKDLYQDGLQVIFDLATWGKDAGKSASLLTTMVSDLLDYAKALPPHVRVPFLVGLDEAAYWLPQSIRGKSYLSESRFKELFAVFHHLTLRGRKLGLIPLLFTQRFASVHKDVLTTTGTFILMKQTVDTDLKRCMEYINAAAFGKGELTEKQIKVRIAAFKPGQAIIRLPNGKQGIVQFYNRASEHSSHAPKAEAALSTYRTVAFDPDKSYGAFRAEGEGEVQEHPQTAVHPPAPGSHDSPFEAPIRALLAENPEATSRMVAAQAHCSRSAAKKWMRRIQQDELKAGSVVEARIRALLSDNPRATVTEVATHAHCSHSTAKQWMTRILPNIQATGSVVEARIRALLSDNPRATVNQVATHAHCSFTDAKAWITVIQAGDS